MSSRRFFSPVVLSAKSAARAVPATPGSASAASASPAATKLVLRMLIGYLSESCRTIRPPGGTGRARRPLAPPLLPSGSNVTRLAQLFLSRRPFFGPGRARRRGRREQTDPASGGRQPPVGSLGGLTPPARLASPLLHQAAEEVTQARTSSPAGPPAGTLSAADATPFGEDRR